MITSMKNGLFWVEGLLISNSLTLNDFLKSSIGKTARPLSKSAHMPIFFIGKKVLFNKLFDVEIIFNNNKIKNLMLINPYQETWPEINDPKEIRFRDECINLIKDECGKNPPYYFESGVIGVELDPKNNFHYLFIRYED